MGGGGGGLWRTGPWHCGRDVSCGEEVLEGKSKAKESMTRIFTRGIDGVDETCFFCICALLPEQSQSDGHPPKVYGTNVKLMYSNPKPFHSPNTKWNHVPPPLSLQQIHQPPTKAIHRKKEEKKRKASLGRLKETRAARPLPYLRKSMIPPRPPLHMPQLSFHPATPLLIPSIHHQANHTPLHPPLLTLNHQIFRPGRHHRSAVAEFVEAGPGVQWYIIRAFRRRRGILRPRLPAIRGSDVVGRLVGGFGEGAVVVGGEGHGCGFARCRCGCRGL